MPNPKESLNQAAQDDERRAYMREYQRELRKKRKRLELSLTTEDYRRLEKAAKEHGLKVATFVREALLTYLDGCYLVPEPERVAELELALRRIATDVNRIARSVNKQVPTSLDTASINERLVELEEVISITLREPPELLNLVATHAAGDPVFANRVRAVLDNPTRDGDGLE